MFVGQIFSYLRQFKKWVTLKFLPNRSMGLVVDQTVEVATLKDTAAKAAFRALRGESLSVVSEGRTLFTLNPGAKHVFPPEEETEVFDGPLDWTITLGRRE